MGAETLLSARTELRARGFDYLSDTRADRLINDAYQWLLRKYLWPFLEETVTGDAPVTIGELGPVSEVVDTSNNDRRLVYRDRGVLVERYGDLTVAGTPRYWYFDAPTTIATYPAGGSLRVRHFQHVAVVEGDNAIFVVPDGWMQIVIDRACYRAYLDRDNAEMARLMRDEVDAALLDMVVDQLGQQVSDPDQIVIYGDNA